jgi:ATP-dependent exoDNAse (exonuclease V) alpha subunit
MGTGTPEAVTAEARRQGLMVKDGLASTNEMLAMEQKIIDFARDGRGTCKAMGAMGELPDLSKEQRLVVNHILTSQDRVILAQGQAGTGKTHTMKYHLAASGKPVAVLAPSAEASRGVLRKEGFDKADTVASFIQSTDRQMAVRGGIIFVDEAGLLPVRDLSRLVDIAKHYGCRIILQGDNKQHRAVSADGNMLHVLAKHANLPVARLTDIRRQRGAYKEAVNLLASGKLAAGAEAFDKLGWIKSTDTTKPIVDDYMEALRQKKSVLIVSPTHAEGNAISEAVRNRLKEAGAITGQEREFDTLQALHLTEAERGDVHSYTGAEVLQYHKNGGTFRAGQRVKISAFKPKDRMGKGGAFSVYTPTKTHLAVGDKIRMTANGKTKDGKRLNNGAQYTVEGFTEKGDIRLNNGQILGKDYGHFAHAYVSTSHASQGKTVDRVIVALGRESLPAINAHQFYVSLSRGREQATVYTDMDTDTLKDAVQRMDTRKAAVEVFGERKRFSWLEKVKRMWYEKFQAMTRTREVAHELER